MKKLFPFLVFLMMVIPQLLQAQTSHVVPGSGSDTIAACGDTIYDVGGANGDYSDNANGMLVIHAANANNLITLIGTYATENNYDYISIYDGAGTTGELLAHVSGTGSINVSSTGEYITILFTSDVSSGDSGFSLVTSCSPIPACAVPLHFALSSSTPSTLSFHWTDTHASSWNVKYSTATFDGDTTTNVNSITVNDTACTLTNLTANTLYYVRVQANCGILGTSAWTSILTAQTRCEEITQFPFSEGFETATVNNVPSCWNNYFNTASVNSYPTVCSDVTNSYQSTKCIRFYNQSYTIGDQYLILPAVNTTLHGLNTLSLSFKYKFSTIPTSTTPTLLVGVMTDPANTATFTTVQTITATGTTYQTAGIDLGAFTGTGEYLAIKLPHVAGGGFPFGPSMDFYLYVDDVTLDLPASCARPSGVVVSNVASNSVHVSWNATTATSYIVEYGPANFVLGSGTQMTATTNAVNLTNLSASTHYDVYVKGICAGADTSANSFATSFTTSCGELTVLPLNENFDTYTATTSTTTENLPTCWTRINTGTSNVGCPIIYNSNSFAHSGNNSLYFYSVSSSGGADQYAIMPPISTTAHPINTLTMTFYMRARQGLGTTNYSLQVGVMSNPSVASSFVPVHSFTVSSQTYAAYDVDFSTFTGTGNYIAFKMTTTNSPMAMGLHIDDIQLSAAAACPRPTAVTVNAVTHSQASISWTDTASSSWEVQYGLTGFTAGTSLGTSVQSSMTSATLTSLLPDTPYDVYVRSNCSDGTHSAWSLVASFRTSCAPVTTLPYTENFDTYSTGSNASINACWRKGTNSTTHYPYPEDDFYCSSGKSLYLYSTSSVYSYVALPAFQDSLQNLMLSFKLYKDNNLYSNSLTIGVMTNPNDVNTFTAIGVASPNESEHWTDFQFDFSNYIGDGYIAIMAPKGIDSRLYLDNLTVQEIPVCSVPQNLTFDQTVGSSTIVRWTPGTVGTTGSYNVQYKASTQTVWDSVTVNNTYALLSNLTVSTVYNVRVKTTCADNTESSWLTGSFTTSNCLAGGDVECGHGTTSLTLIPICCSYKSSYTQQMFTAEDLSGARTFNGLAVNKATSSVNDTRNISIYLGNTNQSNLTSATFIPNVQQTMVFNGNVTFVNGWTSITFDSLFHYTGSNMVVTFIDHTDSAMTSQYFYTSNSNVSTLYSYSDDTIADPNVNTSISVNTYGRRANMRFFAVCGDSTCAAPNVVITGVTANQVTMSWAPGSTESNWDLAYRPANGAWTNVGSSAFAYYSFANLQPNTTYDFLIISNCGNNADTAEVTATTDCAVISAYPYVESFDTYSTGETSAINPCWYRFTDNSTVTPYVVNTHANGGTNSFYWYKNSGNFAYVVLPTFDRNVNQLQLTFDLFRVDTLYPDNLLIGVMTDREDINTFTQLGSFTPNTANEWQSFELLLNQYQGQGQYIAIVAPQSASRCMVYMDNLTVEPLVVCRRPTNVTVSNITVNSAQVNWTSENGSGWLIEYGRRGFTLGTGTVVTSSSTSYTLQNLSAATLYQVYVRTLCGAGDTSRYSFVTNFATDCGPITLPYVENFDSWTATTSGEVANLPLCWTHYTAGTTNAGLPAIYNNSNYAASGNNSLKFNIRVSMPPFFTSYDADQYAIFPPVGGNYSINQLQLNCKMRRASNNADLVIGAMANPNDVSTFVPIDTVSLTSNDYSYLELPLSNYSGSNSYLALKASNTTTHNLEIYVDDIMLDIIPACARVAGFHYTDASASTAVAFAWNASVDAVSYDISYGPVGFSPENGGTVITGIGDTTTTITDIPAGSEYDFYIRGNCGSGYSYWTLAPVRVAPGMHLMSITGTDTLTACGATIYDNGGPGNNYANNANSTLIIYPSSEDSLVSIYGTFAGEHNYDSLIVYSGVGTSGPVIGAFNSATSGATVNVGPLTSFSGPLTIRFHSDGSANYAGFTLFESCVAIPDCRQPINVTVNGVGADSVALSWYGFSNTIWQVVTSASPTTPDSSEIAAAITAADTFLTIYNLQPNTTYYLYVRGDCSPIYSSWSQPVSFTTHCIATGIPYSDNFDNDVAGTSAPLPDCWTRINNAASTSYNYYPYIMNTTENAYSGSHVIYFNLPNSNNAADQYAVLPFVDTTVNSINSLQLSFFGKANPAYTNSSVIVGIMSSVANENSFVPVDTLNMSASAFHEYVVSFENYQGYGNYVAFRFPKLSSGTNSGFIDNVTLDNLATCPHPLNFTATSTEVDIRLDWTESGNAGQWEILYGSVGFDPTTGGTIIHNVTTHPYSINNVSLDSLYDFYVRSICSNSEYSSWSMPASAQIGLAKIPFSGTDTTYKCSGIITDYAGPAANYGNSANGTLVVYPGSTASKIHLTGTYSISNDHLYVYDGVGTTGTLLTQVSGNGTMDVTSLTGPVTLRFTSDGSAVSTGFSLNVACEALASCVIPSAVTASNAQMNAADLTWTGGTGDASYIIEYGSVGFVPGNGTTVTTATNSISLTGLTANTSYDAYVRAICVAGDTTVNAPVVSFMTMPCANACVYNVAMTDSYGDGWEGGFIAVSDASHNLMWTVSNGHSATDHFISCGGPVTFSWTGGGSPSEVGFVITNGQNDTLYTCTSAASLSGQFFADTCVVTACDAPTNLTANPSDFGAVLSWSGTGDFEVSYKAQSATSWSANSTVHANLITLNNLDMLTAYDWRVRKVCDYGVTSAWATASFTTTGIEDYSLSKDITLYPNPSTQYVDVRVNNTNILVKEIRVYDVYGKLLQTISVNENPTRIDVSALANGMYFVRVVSDKGIANKSFIKK